MIIQKQLEEQARLSINIICLIYIFCFYIIQFLKWLRNNKKKKTEISNIKVKNEKLYFLFIYLI
jgi:hypothetical protein